MKDTIENINNQMIVVSDNKKGGLPFSKGILANSIIITGLDMLTSHKIAFDIQDYLIKNGINVISAEELRALVLGLLRKKLVLNLLKSICFGNQLAS